MDGSKAKVVIIMLSYQEFLKNTIIKKMVVVIKN